MERSRTVTWADPMIGAQAAAGMSGLEYLLTLKRGDLPIPPVAALIGFDFGEIEKGRVTFTFTPGEHHYNVIGSVHGGIVSTLLDSATGSAVHSMLPAGTGYTTLEIKVNFLRALSRDTGELTCEGRTVYMGSRVAVAEGRILGETDRLYAYATSTCLIFAQAD